MTVSEAFSNLRRHFLALVLCLGAASMGLAPSLDGDVWWHLAAGREMLTRGELLLTDPFSVSAAGRPWIDVHWLFQLGAYAVHRSWGLAGLVWVKCALIGAGALLLLAALGRRRASLWARPTLVTLLLGALFVARSLLLVRPVMLSLLLLAAFFWALESFSQKGRVSRLWLLPLLQVVWSNCQGLSALGPAVVGAYVVAAALQLLPARWGSLFARESAAGVPALRHFKLLSLALLGCGVGACITPYGLRALTLPATLFSRLVPGEQNLFAQAIAENVPPFVLERWTAGEFWHVKWFLGVLALAILVGGRRVRLSHLLLVLGFAGLGLMSNRNVLLFYWIATPIAALHVGPFLRRIAHAGRGFSTRRVVYVLNAATLAGVLCLSGAAAAHEPSLAEPGPFRMPSESAQRLQRLPPGDVFSADHQGGYLIWALFPRFRPYIDTRLVLRSQREFSEYLGLAEQPARFEAFQARHRFGYVVLPTSYPDRYLGLIRQLYASSAWKLLYTDGAEVLFARADLTSEPAWNLAESATTERILSGLRQRFAGAGSLLAAAQLQLATLHAALGEVRQAEHALSGLDVAEAQALRARFRFAGGDLAGAERLVRGVLAHDRDDVRSLSLLAQIAMKRGQPPQVLRFLRRALSVDPFDPEANQLLINLEETER